MSRSYRYSSANQLHREFERLQAIVPPAKIETPVTRPNAALLGTKEERDAFADKMLRREREMEEQARNVRAAIQDELRTEGRVHVNTRPQRHE